MPNAPAAAETDGDQAPQQAGLDGGGVPHRPEPGKVCRDSGAVPAKQNAQQNQSDQGESLRRSKNILDVLAETQAARIGQREKYDQDNSNQLLRGKAQRVFGRKRDRGDDPRVGRNRGREHAEEAGECNRYRRNRSGLNDQEKRPAVEKTPQRRIGFAQVDVLSARLGHHRRKLAIGKRRGNRQDAGNNPGEEQTARRTRLPGDVGGHDEDAGANHRADDNHGGVEQAQAADKPRLGDGLRRGDGGAGFRHVWRL